ncbi:hypothetical protein KR222_000360 [Zaprionus bogoriensis]|nr:hypothetical protein KR222_000360 [Zaprionus bogoriensis]
MSQFKETGIGTDPQDAKLLQLSDVDKKALKDMLQQRLKECGWSSEIEQRIRNVLEERGVNNVTHGQLSAEIVPHARALVPEDVRKEMLLRMREALDPQCSTVQK